MAISASWDLQKSVFNSLVNDGALTVLLGGQSIFDDVPQRASYPYITFGQTSMRDWSTGTDGGKEHTVTLHVWSKGAGKNEVFEIINVICEKLHDSPLQLTDHHLINLRCEFSEARRTVDGEKIHGIVRYRAVTEPV